MTAWGIGWYTFRDVRSCSFHGRKEAETSRKPEASKVDKTFEKEREQIYIVTEFEV